MRYTILIILALLALSVNAEGPKDAFEISGDILEYAMPAMALGSTFIWKGYDKPHWQFLKSMGTAIGTAYILKKVVRKKRPDYNEWNPRYDSFPSGHTTSAFMSAAFMERRYGWKVGVPAYIVAGYVGWSRVHANRHDWWDVLGGAVVGTASSYLFTKAYKKDNLDLAINLAPQSLNCGLKLRF